MSELAIQEVNDESNHFSEFDENLESYRFVIRTVQASAFRTLKKH